MEFSSRSNLLFAVISFLGDLICLSYWSHLAVISSCSRLVFAVISFLVSGTHILVDKQLDRICNTQGWEAKDSRVSRCLHHLAALPDPDKILRVFSMKTKPNMVLPHPDRFTSCWQDRSNGGGGLHIMAHRLIIHILISALNLLSCSWFCRYIHSIILSVQSSRMHAQKKAQLVIPAEI